MIITKDITAVTMASRSVALGFFDGVHLGHQAVVGAAVKAAAEQELCPCVFTFCPTGMLPGSKNGLTLLQTEQQKEQVLDGLGVKEIITPSFESFMNLSPKDFVEELLYRRLGARVLVCGENYRFGKGAAGSVELLRQLSEPLGIRVVAVPAVCWQGETVSSTRIREALQRGEVEQVDTMLGAHFSIEGEVLHGKGLGRTLSSPTINQSIPNGFTIPAHGVYLSHVTLEGQPALWGVTNIGNRPTVAGETINCETYLLDFSGNLYGQEITTSLLRYLRPERHFPTLEGLSQQIAADVKTARSMIEGFTVKII